MNKTLNIIQIALLCLLPLFCTSQREDCTIIKGTRLFDGERMHTNMAILVRGKTIDRVAPPNNIKNNTGCQVIEFPNSTILPGMIEGHSHLLLHPYNETGWNDQVLKESYAERAIRGGVHAEKTIEAGFTTVRDLGSEGAGYVDVGLKESIEKGIIPGPRMIVAGKAIVTTGSYGPKGFGEHVTVPLGAETADGYDDLIRVVRDQIGNGADVIKVYADYRWGLMGEAQPTFTQKEIELIVEITESSGRHVVAHAASAEGMRRAILAGVRTIEHGDGGTGEIFKLMKDYHVALCPTIAAGDAIMQYRGWNKDVDPEPERIINKRESMRLALDAGVTIVAGGDVGVFSHGDNVRELEMMVDYGMQPIDVLKSVTSINADVFGYGDRIGRLESGMLADIVVVQGNPIDQISDLRNVKMVMKDGNVYSK